MELFGNRLDNRFVHLIHCFEYVNQRRDPIVGELFDLVRVSQYRIRSDMGPLIELLERLRKLAMQITRLQLQPALKKGVGEPAAARIERTLPAGRPFHTLLLFEPGSAHYLGRWSHDTQNVPNQFPQGSRELVRAHLVVGLAEDMQGTVQRVMRELVWQSLPEALQ